MVRFDSTSVEAATAATCSIVTSAIREGSASTSSALATVSKYPSWCAMFVTLSLSKTSLAFSWALAFDSSPSVMPPRRTSSSAASIADSTEASAVPSVAVADTL